MASVQVSSVTALLSQDGMANGRVKIATLDGFVLNAYCYLISSTQPSTPCVILGTDAMGNIILGKAVEIGVRGTDYGLLDTTSFLVGDGAQLSMPAQVVSQIVSLSTNDGGMAGTGGIIPAYVPSGNLLQGNNFSTMHFIPPGSPGNILVSDGDKWYGSASSPDGVQSIQAGDGIEVTGGETAAPTIAVKNAGYVKAPAGSGPFAAGTPVAIADGVVVACDASDPDTFPCVGLWTSDNHICTSGLVSGLSGLPADSEIFIAVGGGLTGTCPNDPDTVEQKVGASIGSVAIFVSIRNEIYN